MRDMVVQRNKEVPVQGPEGKKHQLAAVRGHGLTNHQLEQLKTAKFPILAMVGDLVCKNEIRRGGRRGEGGGIVDEREAAVRGHGLKIIIRTIKNI